MASGDITHVGIDGALMNNTGTYTVLYTVPAGKQAIYVELVICNIDTTGSYGAYVTFIPSGGAGSLAYHVIAHRSAGGTYMAPGETQIYKFTPMLDPGDYIYAAGDTANKIAIRGGVTLKEI